MQTKNFFELLRKNPGKELIFEYQPKPDRAKSLSHY